VPADSRAIASSIAQRFIFIPCKEVEGRRESARAASTAHRRSSGPAPTRAASPLSDTMPRPTHQIAHSAHVQDGRVGVPGMTPCRDPTVRDRSRAAVPDRQQRIYTSRVGEIGERDATRVEENRRPAGLQADSAIHGMYASGETVARERRGFGRLLTSSILSIISPRTRGKYSSPFRSFVPPAAGAPRSWRPAPAPRSPRTVQPLPNRLFGVRHTRPKCCYYSALRQSMWPPRKATGTRDAERAHRVPPA
jgi:hypothetical protein